MTGFTTSIAGGDGVKTMNRRQQQQAQAAAGGGTSGVNSGSRGNLLGNMASSLRSLTRG
jgi:hypothetical protein